MKKLIDDVSKLHHKMGAPLPKTTDYAHAIYRMKFLLEELQETIKACGLHVDITNVNGKDVINIFPTIDPKIDEEEVIDGLIDLMVVVIGTALFFGYSNKIGDKTIFEIAWDRVQEANMEKIPVKSEGESKRGNKFDLKKPEGWKKPTFKDLFEKLKKGESHGEVN